MKNEFIQKPILNEYWTPIPDYNVKYLINKVGIIRSLHNKSKKNIKARIDRAGYYTVRLSIDSQTHTHYVHRLIAKTFIANPKGLKFVNHKNGIKTDNTISNLEWVSHATNMKHAYKLFLIPKGPREKKVFDIASGIEYSSIKIASEKTGLPYSSLKNYLNGRRKNKTSIRYKSLK